MERVLIRLVSMYPLVLSRRRQRHCLSTRRIRESVWWSEKGKEEERQFLGWAQYTPVYIRDGMAPLFLVPWPICLLHLHSPSCRAFRFWPISAPPNSYCCFRITMEHGSPHGGTSRCHKKLGQVGNDLMLNAAIGAKSPCGDPGMSFITKLGWQVWSRALASSRPTQYEKLLLVEPQWVECVNDRVTIPRTRGRNSRDTVEGR